MKFQISCLSESSPEWLSRVQNLVLSIRRFGGDFGNVPIVAYFVDGVPAPFERYLRELDVAVRVVRPIPGMARPTNKLRMFEIDEGARFDFLVTLDCDVIVVDDFADRIPAAAIGIKPADYPTFADRDWRELYEKAGLPLPAASLAATSTGEPMPPYFNSGVVTAPRELCAQLGDRWRQGHRDLTAWLGGDPHLIPRHLHYFGDQLALALAIAAGELPYSALPVGMNFPTHAPVHPPAPAGERRLSILHYHGEVDERGYLLRPRSEEAAAAANAFNEHRAEQLGLDYEGLGSHTLLDRARSALHEPRRMLARRHRARSWLRDRRLAGESGPGARPAADGFGVK
jgi:hypothetical protein